MKRLYFLLIPALILASCGGGSETGGDLASLKKQRAALDAKIKELEAGSKDSLSGKVTAIAIQEVQSSVFNGFIEVQSQITGDEVVNATARTMGTVNNIYVHVGQHVSKGQVLGTLDDAVAEQQIKALEPQIELAKALYDKQQKLWKQNIGTEVQLMSAKTQYENLLKQKAVAKAGKDLNNIIAPISGTVDYVGLKVGDQSAAGYIRIVNTSKLKAEANLGENYIGKVKIGDPATLIFPDMRDSISANITYVSKAVDPLSRAFMVQIKLSNESKLHPNMSCIMKISNYENPDAIVIPVSVIQKTAKGEIVYVTDGKTAKSVTITTGRSSNGKVEVLSGLQPGDKLIVAGFEDLDNGSRVKVM